MPHLSIFSSSTNTCIYKNSSHIIHPNKSRITKIWSFYYSKSSISMNKSRNRFIWFLINRLQNTFLPYNKHGHHCSVLTFIFNSISSEFSYIRRIFWQFGSIYSFNFKIIHIYSVLAAWIWEWCVWKEEFSIITPSFFHWS